MANVSLGKQLIDLKAAVDADAITDSEYKEMKEGLVNAANMCAAADGDEESWFF